MFGHKGILSPSEVSALRAAPPDQQVNQLVLLLKQKGVFTDSDVGSLNNGAGSLASPMAIVSTGQPTTTVFAGQVTTGSGNAVPHKVAGRFCRRRLNQLSYPP